MLSKFDCEKDNSAFNLTLVSELAPLHRGGADYDGAAAAARQRRNKPHQEVVGTMEWRIIPFLVTPSLSENLHFLSY